jgi:hypothetical protein
VWRIRRQTPRDASRRRACRRAVLDAGGSVEQAPTGHGAEGDERRPGEAVEQDPDLVRGVLVFGPMEIQSRPQPAEGGADQARANRIAPAPEGATGDRRLPRAREGDPFVGHLHAVTEDVSHRLQDGAHRGPAAPHLGGHERGRRARTEPDPENGEAFEDIPRGQILDVFAPTATVETGACAGPAGRTLQPRLADEIR